MKFKKLIGLIMTIAISMSSVTTFAAFTDVDPQASFSKALDEVSALGIIKGLGDGTFSPYDSVSREQFATMIVKAAGLDKKASNLYGSSVFIDVNPYDWSTGYINAAVNKGYITGMSDNRFYPKDNISFAEACTILDKALGYSDSNLSGTWPKNYIEKAKTLGLTSGINLNTSESLPRWAAAVMINNLLDTDVYSAATSTTTKTFAESTGVYVDSFIFANSSTNTKLMDNQIQTDKGIYYVDNSLNLQLGGKYRFVIDPDSTDKILYAYNKNANVKNISVDSIIDNKVTYKENGEIKTIILPDKTTYYYGGVQKAYTDIKSAIAAKSSIVMIYNDDNTGFDYGLVFDPVMSKPCVLQGDGADANIPADFDIKNTTIIAKGTDDNGDSIDGKLMNAIELKAHDVLYKVNDIWGQNKHILLVRNSVKGTIKSILPDKVSPTSVTIDSTKYELGSDFDSSKLNTTSGAFKLDDEVILVLGNDGKAVDMFYRDYGDNKNYALVLNSSVELSDASANASTVSYKVTLLHTDGSTGTYNISHNASDYKGKLVTFEKLDNTHVAIEDDNVVDYMDTSIMHDHTFEIDNRELDGDYISDNAVIFNLESDVSGSAAVAQVLDLSDISSGKYVPNKVLYYKKTGTFNDITLLVTNDIYDGGYSQAVVYEAPNAGNVNTTYKVMIGGNTYSYSGVTIPSADVGSIFKVKMENGSIKSIVDYLLADAEASKVQAIDSKRIKINDKVYWFAKSANIYIRDTSGTLQKVDSEKVDTTINYVSVKLYLDKDELYGGKVATAVLTY